MSTTAEGINELAVVEKKGRVAEPLYKVEEELLALFDSEDLVSEEQQAEFQVELADALRRAIVKRDAVGRFIRHCETLADASKAEETRLRDRRKWYEAAGDKMRTAVKRILEDMGPDQKGKWQKLEGATFTFSLRNNAPSVKIVDPEQVPERFKQLTLKVSASLLREVLEAVPESLRLRFSQEAHQPDVEIAKTPIKKAFEAGEYVEGADLVHETALVLR